MYKKKLKNFIYFNYYGYYNINIVTINLIANEKYNV